MAIFVSIEFMSSPLSPSFAKGGLCEMSEESNRKRVEIIERFPKLQNYCTRVKTDPILAKYFEDRVTDVLF